VSTSIQSPSEGYTGRDVLEAMAEALNYNQWLARLVTARAPKGCSVLDFGAGSGTFAKAIAKHGYDLR
jgi:2-polyprenyl-3-methyl-5-hydroxy-6-metoxy-1,4-benzoquinol methylase